MALKAAAPGPGTYKLNDSLGESDAATFTSRGLHITAVKQGPSEICCT